MVIRHSVKSVYIIAACVALAAVIVPGARNKAYAQISLPSVPGDLPQLPRQPDVDRRVHAPVERAVDNTSRLAEAWADTAELTVEQAAAQATGLANGVLRNLLIDQDPAGSDIEDRIVVVLVAAGQRDRLSRPGFEIIAERELPSLGMSMLTLRLPLNGSLPQAMQVLRDANPGVAIDYNHVYDFAATSRQETISSAGAGEPGRSSEQGATLRVGIVDSAVMREHVAIAGMRIVDRDFVSAPGLRPRTHGTAVASLIAESSQQQAAVYAASVFFQLPNRAPGATADSLVAALDWLVEERVDVINMSLAGPGNQLLESAIARLAQMNVVVVAAVGNNGPSGDPLYPAAYDGVIGVTAVDRKNRIFRYANRGEQVDFAARGVDVKVADSLSGGWRIESGTSMASPHIAVIVAQVLHSDIIAPAALRSWLITYAQDLGRKGFDPVYGYGLITQPPIALTVN